MKLSQSLEQEQGDEYAVPDRRSSPQESGVTPSPGVTRFAGNAQVVFVDVAAVDVARICRGLPSGLCDISAVEDTGQAVRTIGETVPDLVVCPWEIWSVLGERVAFALSQADMRCPLLVLLLPPAGGALEMASRSTGWTEHLQLLQSIRSMIRLVSEARCGEAAKTLAHADISLDPITRRVMRGDRPLRLSQTTFQLLQILMAEPERVHTREELLRNLRGEQIHVGVRTIDVHVKRLRRELNVFGAPNVIRTVRGVGYAFSHDPYWPR